MNVHKSARLKPLYATLCAIFGMTGFTLQTAAFADDLSGTFTDITGTHSSTGSSINASSSAAQLTLGLYPASSGYSGNLANSVMSATSDAGQSPYYNGPTNLSGVSDITYTTTITNTGASAANYTFDLNLNNSSLLVIPGYTYPNGGGTATAEIGANVALNGSSIWNSGATLSVSSNASQTFSTTNLPSYSFHTTGSGFNNGVIEVVDMNTSNFNGSDYEEVNFGNTSLNIALGLIQPGHSDTITYTLSSSALLSNLSNGGFEAYGGAIATVGDPFGSSGPEFQVVSGPVSAVPEAQTLAMMAPGLMMVAAIARRRAKKQA